MSLHAWLRHLDDEALIAWANRGLLRRGLKLLDGEQPAHWTLDATGAVALLDGHRQQLTGIGFDRLQCSCPSTGVCHHLLCLLAGLRQRLQAEEEPAPTEATPWLVLDAQARLAQLGRAALNRAQRWLAQSCLMEVSIDGERLVATLEHPQQARVIVPRAGGLAAAVCSCRESRCAHLALLVLQLAREADPHAWEEPGEALDAAQRSALGNLDDCCDALVRLGLSGISRLSVARTQALATVLQQADLPHLGRMLARLARLLDDEQQGMAASSAGAIRRLLAELLAHRRALARSPLPQPLERLAGVHRRAYRPCRELPLIGLAAECWETLSGYRGYTLHFLCPRDGRCYSLSESRLQALDPDWEPEVALAHLRFAGQEARALLGQALLLEVGWVSEEGRLSNRDGTRLRLTGNAGLAALSAHAEAPDARLLRIAEHRLNWLYRGDPDAWGLVCGCLQEAPAFDRIGQRWMGSALGDAGQAFRILLPGTPIGAAAHKRLCRLINLPGLLFGRWSYEDGLPTLTPVALITAERIHLLCCEPLS